MAPLSKLAQTSLLGAIGRETETFQEYIPDCVKERYPPASVPLLTLAGIPGLHVLSISSLKPLAFFVYFQLRVFFHGKSCFALE